MSPTDASEGIGATLIPIRGVARSTGRPWCFCKNEAVSWGIATKGSSSDARRINIVVLMYVSRDDYSPYALTSHFTAARTELIALPDNGAASAVRDLCGESGTVVMKMVGLSRIF
jgi:hypothetical protein